jgi:phage repressor protein C with HTH and peptisase S24 domain
MDGTLPIWHAIDKQNFACQAVDLRCFLVKSRSEPITRPFVGIEMPPTPLKRILVEKDIRLDDLAEGTGLSVSYLSRLVAGKRHLSTKHIPKIASYLGVAPQDLIGNDLPVNSHNSSRSKVNVLSSAPRIVPDTARPDLPHESAGGAARLPIRGRSVVGKDGVMLNPDGNDVVDTVEAPTGLTSIRGAYAIFITDNRMDPRYEQGEVVCVNPHRPPRPNDYVVIQISEDDGKTVMAMARRLVSMDDREVVVAQLNPPKTRRLPRKQVLAVHRIAWGGSPA